MRLNDLYRHIKEKLQNARIASPSFEAKWILRKVVKTADIRMSGELEVSEKLCMQAVWLAGRRAEHVPLQYLLGEWEFMGFPILVGEGVLIPRPETEELCENMIIYARERETPPARILDLCAGSGCIAIAMAKHFPDAEVIAVEKSAQAVNYLKRNVRLNQTKVAIEPIDIRKRIPDSWRGSFDLVLSNPPYIPEKELGKLQKEVRYEPMLALNGGADGLLFYRTIVKQWKKVLALTGILGVEIGIGQELAVLDLFLEEGFHDVHAKQDLQGVTRMVFGTWNGTD